MEPDNNILVLGLGNVLLGDDGVGIHVVEALRQRDRNHARVLLRDGGTIGMALLPDIEAANSLIVVDATVFEGEAGAVAVFEGGHMDEKLRAKPSSVHEVALADLMAAATLMGSWPKQRALVGIRPANIDWGLEPSQVVSDAIPAACAAIDDLVDRWQA